MKKTIFNQFLDEICYLVDIFCFCIFEWWNTYSDMYFKHEHTCTVRYSFLRLHKSCFPSPSLLQGWNVIHIFIETLPVMLSLTVSLIGMERRISVVHAEARHVSTFGSHRNLWKGQFFESFRIYHDYLIYILNRLIELLPFDHKIFQTADLAGCKWFYTMT